MESDNSETENSIIDESVANSASSASKRKRGRPKKSDLPKDKTPNSNSKAVSIITKDDKTERRSIKKPKRYLDMETEPSGNEEFVSSTATKKSSYRNHKSQSWKSDGENKDNEDDEIKTEKDEDILNSEVSKEVPSGKKKGRPKKKVQHTSSEDQSPNISVSDIPDNSENDIDDENYGGMKGSNVRRKGNKDGNEQEAKNEKTPSGRKSKVGNEQEVKNEETPSGRKSKIGNEQEAKNEKTPSGRKSKVGNEQEVKNEETPSGRKRGRPKSKKSTSGEKIVENNVQPDFSTDKEQDLNYQTPTVRKRGGSRKTNTPNRDADSEEEDKNEEKEDRVIEMTNSGRKRGRPKQTKKDFSSQKESDEEIDETNEVLAKNGDSCKKRGKPKDSVTPNKQEESETFINDSTGSVSKRLPGRSRKTESLSEPLPKKRGRPKKNLGKELESAKKKRKASMTSSDEEEETKESVTPSNKRGRPKKYAKRNRDESPENEFESPLKEAIKCVHCEEKFWDKTQLKWHMMKTHCAVWSKDCPEGKTDNAALKIILKRVGKIICPKCGKEIKWIQYYRKHEEWCGRETELSDCPVCNRPIMTMWMKEHLQLHKKQERLEEEKRLAEEKKDKEEPVSDSEEQTNRGGKKRSAAKKAQNLLHQINEKGELVDQNTVDYASDAEILSEASDDDDEGEDIQESDEIKSESEPEEPSHSNRSERNKTEKCIPYKYISIGLKDTLKYFRKIYGTGVLFPEYMPQKSNWTRMKDVVQYLPTVKESVNFIVTNKNLKLKKNPSFTQTAMTKLRLFESVVINDNCNFFVGGPVWGLEWCPVPIATGEFDNYLAVSCELSNEEMTHFSPCSPKPGLIQIWNIKTLQLGKPCSQPQLEFCMAHDYGSVKCIKWCPSGCWQNPDLIPESDDNLSRAGILGLACSDGMIHIYSIPHASALNQTEDNEAGERSEKSEVKMYKPQPVLNLIPSTAKGSWSPCFCMAWQIQNDHQYVAGGYGDGTIRVWNLHTTSLLLKSSTPSGINILPFKTFIGDAKAITCCDWSIHSANHFSTGGWGQEMKVWSLQDSHYPMVSEKSQATNKVEWSIHTMGVYTCTDDGYCHNHCYVRCNTFGLLKKEDVRSVGHGVSNSNASNWSCTCSDWVKMLFSSDNKGRLLGVMMRDPYREYIGKVKKLRFIVYDTDLKQIPADDNKDVNKKDSDSALSLDGLNKENTKSDLIGQSGEPIKNKETNYKDNVMDNSIGQKIVSEKEDPKKEKRIEKILETVSSKSDGVSNDDQKKLKDYDSLSQKKYLQNLNLKEMKGDKCFTVPTEIKNDQKKNCNKNMENLNKEISSPVQTNSKNSSGNKNMTVSKSVNLKNSTISASVEKNVDNSQLQNGHKRNASEKGKQGISIGQGTSIGQDKNKGAKNNLKDAKDANSIIHNSNVESNSETVTVNEMVENISPEVEIGNNVKNSSKALSVNEQEDKTPHKTAGIEDEEIEEKTDKKTPAKKNKTKDKKDGNHDDNDLPKTYQDCVDNFYLEYKDHMENNCKVIDEEDKVHVYPLSALYRAVINPNYHASTWIVSGGEAGIIRIHNIFEILSTAAKREIGSKPSVSYSDVLMSSHSVKKTEIEDEKCVSNRDMADNKDGGQTIKNCGASKSGAENGQLESIISKAMADTVDNDSVDDR